MKRMLFKLLSFFFGVQFKTSTIVKRENKEQSQTTQTMSNAQGKNKSRR